jgi:hypothetical protein
MEGELLSQVVVNLPNFIFAAVSMAILYRQNQRLMDIVEKWCDRCDGDESAVEQAERVIGRGGD